MQSRIDYKKLGLRIKSIRISKNLTHENLAQLVDCNVSHISNIENNHTKVSLIMLLSIANALNTSIDYLLSEQYENRSLALDNEILRAIKNCDNIKKEKILKVCVCVCVTEFMWKKRICYPRVYVKYFVLDKIF